MAVRIKQKMQVVAFNCEWLLATGTAPVTGTYLTVFLASARAGTYKIIWEYRPGSTLFVVWSQNRSDSFDDPSFRPWESVRGSFADEGQNIFLVKLNYWLGM